MQKLIAGIVEFRRKLRPAYRERFAHLALGQSPDSLFVACSDSRVVPNLFASTEPGDLFVVRNVGNLIPPCDANGSPLGDKSEGAAVEFALDVLGVKDIIVCGHSECGAMRAVLSGEISDRNPNLQDWLTVAARALPRLHAGEGDTDLSDMNRLSQLNTLQQLEHLASYPQVAARLAQGTVRLHAWWFDLHQAEVQAYDAARGRFVVLGDEG